MSIKNSEVWFSFLENQTSMGPAPILVRAEPLGESQMDHRNHTPPPPAHKFLYRIEHPDKTQDECKASLTLATALVDEGPVSGGIRSGDPSIPLMELDSAFRTLRAEYPSLPLLALVRPECYRPRSHAWMLGEYLAERDLLLWADLSHLHPARMADWARNLSECGLASPRAVIQVTERLSARDLPVLTGTGVWLVRPEVREGKERFTLDQLG